MQMVELESMAIDKLVSIFKFWNGNKGK